MDTTLILDAVKGKSLDDGTAREWDLKLAGPAPSQHIFPLQHVHDRWDEFVQANG